MGTPVTRSWKPRRKVLSAAILGPVIPTLLALIFSGFTQVALAAFLSALATALVAYLTPDPAPSAQLVEENPDAPGSEPTPEPGL